MTVGADEDGPKVRPAPPDLDSFMAALLGDPWRIPIGTLAGLTDRQIVCLYLHPRDKDGRVKPRHTLGEVPGPAADALFVQMAREMGVRAEAIEALTRKAAERGRPAEQPG